MKVLQTEMTPGNNSFISIVERNLPAFTSPFHSHPEMELVLVLEGTGKRIVGDHVAPFAPGDLVLIGSNLPHRWISDEPALQSEPLQRARSLVLYFNTALLGSAFCNTPETQKIKELFQKAARGMVIHGHARNAIAHHLQQLYRQKGFGRVLGFFSILHEISCASEFGLLTSANYRQALPDTVSDRFMHVRKYVQEHYSEDISLHKVAGMANLTRPSFCRLFRQRNKKHFTEYLNEVRIAQARRHLQDTDLGVAEIAHQCGYKTVSNFNKQFKKITGETPKAYRIKLSA